MAKTRIEWCDRTVNSVKGLCKYNCWYCYARKLYKRWGWDTEVRFDINILIKEAKIKKPQKIFIGSTHDIFGYWIPDQWIKDIIYITKQNPQHIYLFLTKNPARYENFNFPKNCWLGQTITGGYGDVYLPIKTNICFISYEPMFAPLEHSIMHYDWIVCGGLTGEKTKSPHKKEWIDKIVENGKKYNVKIFIKDNAKYDKVIKEFPQQKTGGE